MDNMTTMLDTTSQVCPTGSSSSRRQHQEKQKRILHDVSEQEEEDRSKTSAMSDDDDDNSSLLGPLEANGKSNSNRSNVEKQCGHKDYNESFSHSLPFMMISDVNPILETCFPSQCKPDKQLAPPKKNKSYLYDPTALDANMAQRVVEYAHRRLAKSQVHTLCCSSTSNRDTYPKVLSHSGVNVHKLLGEGTFSAVYSMENDSLLEHQGEEPEDQQSSSSSSWSSLANKSHKNNKPKESQKYVLKVLRKQLLEQPPLLAASAAGLMKEGLLLYHCRSHVNILNIHAWGTKFGLDGYASGRSDAFFLILERLNITLYDKLHQWRDEKHRLVQKQASQRRKNLMRSLFRKIPIMMSRKKKNKRTQQQQQQHEPAAENDNVNLKARCQVWLELARGVSYLHQQHILHRDLKPDNIGFDAQGTLKIFDLEMSRVLPRLRQDDDLYHFTKKVGSYRYMAPECARGEPYNTKADVYAVALMIHEVYTLKKPFDGIHCFDPMGVYFDPALLECDDDTRPPLPYSVLRPNSQHKTTAKALKPNVAAPQWPSSLVRLLETSWGESIQDRPTMAQLEQQLEQEVIPQIIKVQD